VAALKQLHQRVVVHDDLFEPDTDDDVWLAEVGRRGMVVLTKDDKIRYRRGEQQAILRANVRCFCLNPSKGLTGPDQAEAFVRALPEILRVARTEPGGYIKGVNRKGEVRHLYPR
jgi:hypothetical protein